MTKANTKKAELVGELRVRRLMLWYIRRGFPSLSNSFNHEGVDLIVFSGEVGRHIVEVLEVTNYGSPMYYIKKGKLDRYIKSLDFFDFLRPRPQKTLVVSFEENLTKKQLAELHEHNITVKVVGYQDTVDKEEADKE